MKQNADSRPVLDLDDLERQLQVAVDSRKSPTDDPLAELARIVKQDDPLRSTGKVGRESTPSLSFDDFLKTPPRSASGIMPQHTPAFEPLFADKAAEPPAVTPSVPEALDVSLDFSREMGRYELEDAAVAGESAVDDTLDKAAAQDDFDRRLANALVETDTISLQPDEADAPKRVDDAPVHDPLNHDPLSDLMPAASMSSAIENPKAPFDDMLAEFEAAMRGAGGEPSAQGSAVASLEPAMVPPPPPELPAAHSGSGITGSAAILGAGIAGAAAVAGGTIIGGASQVAAKTKAASPKFGFASRRGLMIAAGVVGVAVIGMGSLLGFGTALRKPATGPAPVIVAKPGVTKERPANPGGVEVPNQDKEVLQAKPQTAAVERVAPREEQPVDLAAAQRRVQASPEASSTTANGVRQIPGVVIVAPVSTTPPVSAPTPESAPKPVASVPITIAGQPAPTVPALPVSPPATTPTATPATTPSSSAPVATPPRAQAPAAAAAEPRRVRAVPIRVDGEPSPARAQAQPRVVPAAPGVRPASEPDEANAPLRITPAANRAAPQRVASAAPAQEVPATRTASTSGSFAVQLAAEGSQDSARSKFNRIRGQHSSVLGNYEPDIRTAEVNGRSVYRVRVGSFSREEAVSVCERLKASGGTCFVARN